MKTIHEIDQENAKLLSEVEWKEQMIWDKEDEMIKMQEIIHKSYMIMKKRIVKYDEDFIILLKAAPNWEVKFELMTF